jgi:hypothetical protein
MRKLHRKYRSVLLDIERSFSAHRRHYKIGRNGYPSQLKEQALAAIREGASHRVVAHAAGVSRQSITNWLDTADNDNVILPRELTLVENQSYKPRPQPSDGLIQVHLRSGARMEVRLSDLSPSFFDLLNGGAGC